MLNGTTSAKSAPREWLKQSRLVFDEPVTGFPLDVSVKNEKDLHRITISSRPLISLDWIKVSSTQPEAKLGMHKKFGTGLSDYIDFNPSTGIYSGESGMEKKAMGQEYFSYVEADLSDPKVVAHKEKWAKAQRDHAFWEGSQKGNGLSQPPCYLVLSICMCDFCN